MTDVDTVPRGAVATPATALESLEDRDGETTTADGTDGLVPGGLVQ